MTPYSAGPSQPAASESLFPGFPTLDLGRLLRVALRRVWLAALVTGVFIALAVAYLSFAPPQYESVAVIYVDPKNEGAVFDGFRGVKAANWESLDALKSMGEGIRNSAVILRVVDRLELRDDPGFLPAKEGGYRDSEIVEIVGRRVGADLRRGTRLIDVRVRDRSPERARAMAAAFIEEFQELIREQNVAAAARSRETLEEELDAQRRRVLAAEEALQAFRLEHAEIALGEENDFVSQKLGDLDRMLSDAGKEVILRRAEHEQASRVPEEEIERVLEIGPHGEQEHIQKLLLARNQKRAELVKIRIQFQPTHPTYQAYELDLAGLEEQVKEVARNAAESIEKAYERAVAHEAALRRSVLEQNRILVEVDGIRKEFRTLKGGVEAAYATYQRLLDRINDSDVTKGIDESVVRVFSEPLVPAKPASPKKAATLVAATLFGGMSGVALVLGIGLLDRTFRSRQQVESTLGLAVLAELPRLRRAGSELDTTALVCRDRRSLESEGFRTLRTSLSAFTPRSVLLTSPSPGEGKSYCAANLAVLQANMGYRTLLVDADFRRPQMARLFTDPMRGVAGESDLTTQNLCEPTSIKELYLLTCGRYTSDAGEPMNGEIFARMLHEAYQSFDCVIIDTSPLNAVSDGLTYARHADAVVLVVRAGATEAGSAQRALRELQRMRANVVGAVLNASREGNPERDAYVGGGSALALVSERASDPRDSQAPQGAQGAQGAQGPFEPGAADDHPDAPTSLAPESLPVGSGSPAKV